MIIKVNSQLGREPGYGTYNFSLALFLLMALHIGKQLFDLAGRMELANGKVKSLHATDSLDNLVFRGAGMRCLYHCDVIVDRYHHLHSVVGLLGIEVHQGNTDVFDTLCCSCRECRWALHRGTSNTCMQLLALCLPAQDS